MQIPPCFVSLTKNMASVTPVGQRVVIGATALPLMTTIDYTNPFVDKETSKVSAIRTAIKTAVFTFTGVFSRVVGQKLGARYSTDLLKDLSKVDKDVFLNSLRNDGSELGKYYKTMEETISKNKNLNIDNVIKALPKDDMTSSSKKAINSLRGAAKNAGVGDKLKAFVDDFFTKRVFASHVGNVFCVLGGIASVFLLDIPFVNKTLNYVLKNYINPNQECPK